METYRNEEQMQCLAKSEGCKYASGQPVSGGPRQHYRGAGGACGDAFLSGGESAMRKSINIRGCNLFRQPL